MNRYAKGEGGELVVVGGGIPAQEGRGERRTVERLPGADQLDGLDLSAGRPLDGDLQADPAVRGLQDEGSAVDAPGPVGQEIVQGSGVRGGRITAGG